MRIPEIWDVSPGSAGAVEQGIEAGRARDLLYRSQTLVESRVVSTETISRQPRVSLKHLSHVTDEAPANIKGFPHPGHGSHLHLSCHSGTTVGATVTHRGSKKVCKRVLARCREGCS